MNLSKYIAALRNDIVAAASLGDDKAQQIAGVLATALEPSIKLALMSALSDLAAEISQELPDRTVEVRLDGGDIKVVTVLDSQAAPGATDPGAAGFAGTGDPFADFEQAIDDVTGNISRVTLRLVDHIKARAEEAANANGVSLNSWLGNAIRGALRDQSRWAWEPPHRRSYRDFFEQSTEPKKPTAPSDAGSSGPASTGFTKPPTEDTAGDPPPMSQPGDTDPPSGPWTTQN